jgi:hypothetical protein
VVNFCCFLLVLLIEISTYFLMSIPFVIKVVIRLILLTCIGSLVLKKAAKKAAVPTAMRQGSKVKALVEAGVGHTTGHGAAWDQPEVKCRKILVTKIVIIVITASVPR